MTSTAIAARRFPEQLGEVGEAIVGESGGWPLDRPRPPTRAVRVEQRRGDRAHADVALTVVERPAPPASSREVGDERFGSVSVAAVTAGSGPSASTSAAGSGANASSTLPIAEAWIGALVPGVVEAQRMR